MENTSVIIKANQPLTSNEQAIQYWHENILLMKIGKLKIASITFNYLIRGEKSFVDTILMRSTTIKKQFTIHDHIKLMFQKKRVSSAPNSGGESKALIGVSRKDEVAFLNKEPVDRSGILICGYFFYTEGDDSYSILDIPPADIIELSFA